MRIAGIWMSQLLVLALQGVSIGIQQLTSWDTGHLPPSLLMLSSCSFQRCKLTVNPVVNKLEMDKCLYSESEMWLISEILAAAGVIQIQDVTLWSVFMHLPIFRGCHAVMICSAARYTQHLILWDPGGDPYSLDGCNFFMEFSLLHIAVTSLQVVQFYHGCPSLAYIATDLAIQFRSWIWWYFHIGLCQIKYLVYFYGIKHISQYGVHNLWTIREFPLALWILALVLKKGYVHQFILPSSSCRSFLKVHLGH
jgi:hypothetical protein